MNRRHFLGWPSLAALLQTNGLLHGQPRQTIDDPVLQAMVSELERSLRLSIAGETPYFIEYSVEEGQNFACAATMGGLISTGGAPYRLPRAMVRVGSYAFDNTNSVMTGNVRMARYDRDRWPIESTRQQMVQDLWLATDRAYKAAVQEMSFKKSALQNMTQSEKLNDFARQEPLVKILPAARSTVEAQRWNDQVRRLSAIFKKFPKIIDSRVDFDDSASTFYYASSEGSRIRVPESVSTLRVRAESMCADGAIVRNHRFFHSFQPSGLPDEAVIAKEIETMAAGLIALTEAPVGEAYTGPVLFESFAAGQLLAQLIGHQLQPSRDPVSAPGRPYNIPASDLEGRLGSRIMPEWIDIVEDPKAAWKGRPLFGCYDADYEGVEPQKLTIVEKGELKTLLYTRQPVRGHEGSNGHARLPGAFGGNIAAPSNLLVQCTQTVSRDELRKKFLELVAQRRKPYGILVRRLDFPSSASAVELRRLLNSMQGSGGRPISFPLEIFRVYPDGREEAIRGVRFRGLSARSLRDILAAGDDPTPMECLINNAPMSLMGAGGFVAGISVVAPSLLLEEVEIEQPQEERPRLPLVPPPPLISGVKPSPTSGI